MLKIMVVDDALIIRRNLKKFFTELGHEVVAEASNGVEAVKKCSEVEIDLITMDITMPEMDGIEATKIIKKIKKDINIIMMTSHGQEELVVKSLKAGAKNFVLKPVTKEKVEKAVSLLFPDSSNDEDDDTLE